MTKRILLLLSFFITYLVGYCVLSERYRRHMPSDFGSRPIVRIQPRILYVAYYPLGLLETGLRNSLNRDSGAHDWQYRDF